MAEVISDMEKQPIFDNASITRSQSDAEDGRLEERKAFISLNDRIFFRFSFEGQR